MGLEYLYYGLDQFSYYVTAIYAPESHPFFKTSIGTIIGLNAFFVKVFGESLYSLKLVNSFISFCALILFHKSYLLIGKEYKNNKNDNLLSYILFFVPTVLLWTSLLGKDALILFPISLFTYSSLKLINKITLFNIILFLISFILAFYIRPWIPLIMLSSIVVYNIKFNKISLILIVVSIPVLYFISMKLMVTLNIESFDSLMNRVGQLQQSFSRGNSAVNLPIIKTLWDYIYYFIPNAFITLFLPLPFLGTSNIFLWFFSLENLLLLYVFLRYIAWNIKLIIFDKYARFLLFFIISWLLLYVIVSPGNLGTAMRYKVQIIPVILLLALYARNFKNGILKNGYKNIDEN
ncbi:hypothetical protein [uncultured Arcobacter sp.]|uniref:hypothetical protein n=1 Tax=uncultured Arcobacter sp. TaxID=165434 RepID=UPI002631A489|nr:hypothetical protein [uncultured Arcobacter sp.]